MTETKTVPETRTVKRRDRYPITLTASEDLTGSTVRLLHRPRYSKDEGEPLPSGFAGRVVTHVLNGALDVGEYELEIEATWPGEPPTIVTFPTDQDGNPQFVVLKVIDDIG